MGLYLEHNEHPIDGIPRIILEQISDSKDHLSSVTSDEDRDVAIHETRKSCKKIRAVMRLIRPAIPASQYRSENIYFRDLSRMLAGERDARVAIKTLEKLQSRYKKQLNPEIADKIRKTLQSEVDSVTATHQGKTVKDEKVKDAVEQLRTASVRIDGYKWKIKSEHLVEGLTRTYRRGLSEARQAEVSGSDEDLHEWRKRVKYLWHQFKIIKGIWPKVIQPLSEEYHRLSDLLGEEHDLTVLGDKIEPIRSQTLSEEEKEVFRALIRQRKQDYRDRIFPLGRKLFAEKPKALEKRLIRYLNIN